MRWFIIFVSLFISACATGAYNVSPSNENCLQWRLADCAYDDVITGNEVNGVFISAVRNYTAEHTADINGLPAMVFDGVSDYVKIVSPKMWPNAVKGLWAKSPQNPVLEHEKSGNYHIQFGQLCPRTGGGWWYYGAKGNIYNMSIYRWESEDLVHWYNGQEVLESGGIGAWDQLLQVASVIRRPEDGCYFMLYRGQAGYGGTWAMGQASSSDGAVWVRKNNSGINDGKLNDVGRSCDPVGVILYDNIYYWYFNGNTSHNVTDIYASGDLENFSQAFGKVFIDGQYCGYVFYYNGYYYLLLPWDYYVDAHGADVYDHGIGLWRSKTPWFRPNERDFLGFPIINDKIYDARYVDTPTVPFTSVYRNEYAPEFGSELRCLYTASRNSPYRNTLCMATTTFSELAGRKECFCGFFYKTRMSFSFWVQFNNLKSGNTIFSVGSSSNDSSPLWLLQTKLSNGKYYLALYRNWGFILAKTPLAVNVPYHIVVVEEGDRTKIYINGVADGFDTTLQPTETSAVYDDSTIYLGTGYGSYLSGKMADFRIYPTALDANQVNLLYNTGSNVQQNKEQSNPSQIYKCVDIDGNGVVDIMDLSIFTQHWLDKNCQDPQWCDCADINQNGVVNFNDMLIMGWHWLESYP